MSTRQANITRRAKRESMQERIAKHGRQLLAIFPNATERDPIKLCKRLRALEKRANAVAVRLCNGPEYPGGPDAVDKITNAILARVNKLLGNTGGVPVFINRDPRGYAIKVHARYTRELGLDIPRDWGGYGIIAPDLSRD